MNIGVNDQAARDWARQAIVSNAGTRQAFVNWCQANGRDAGGATRERTGTLFSTAAFQWSGASAAPQQQSAPFFSLGEGATDPVLGVLSPGHTNMPTGGILPQNRAFSARALCVQVFVLQVAVVAAAPVPEASAQAALALIQLSSLGTTLGTEAVQVVGPTSLLLGPSPDVAIVGTATVMTPIVATNDQRSFPLAVPFVVQPQTTLRASLLYSPLDLPSSGIDDLIVAARCILIGTDRTGIVG